MRNHSFCKKTYAILIKTHTTFPFFQHTILIPVAYLKAYQELMSHSMLSLKLYYEYNTLTSYSLSALHLLSLGVFPE